MTFLILGFFLIAASAIIVAVAWIVEWIEHQN